MAAALKAVSDDSPANRVDELKAQRADLLAREKLSAARTATGAARGAGANIDAELADLRAKLVALDDEIEIAALECMEGERLAILDELTAVAQHAGKLIARLRAHHLSLGQRGRDLRDAGQHDAAQAYFVQAEALAAVALPDPAPTVGEVDNARLQWQGRFGALRA